MKEKQPSESFTVRKVQFAYKEVEMMTAAKAKEKGFATELPVFINYQLFSDKSELYPIVYRVGRMIETLDERPLSAGLDMSAHCDSRYSPGKFIAVIKNMVGFTTGYRFIGGGGDFGSPVYRTSCAEFNRAFVSRIRVFVRPATEIDAGYLVESEYHPGYLEPATFSGLSGNLSRAKFFFKILKNGQFSLSTDFREDHKVNL